MGSIVGKAMDENMQKQQAFMKENQETVMQRQIQMQNLMRERMMAMQLATAREMFNWWASFYGLAAVGMIAGFLKTKRPGPLVPLVPLTFIVGYQADLAYGTKIERMRGEADRILLEEQGLLQMPGGVPTFEDIESRRAGGK